MPVMSFLICWLSTCTCLLHSSAIMIIVCVTSTWFSISFMFIIVIVCGWCIAKAFAITRGLGATFIPAADNTIATMSSSAIVISNLVATYKYVIC